MSEKTHYPYPSTGQFKNVIKEVTTLFRKNKVFDFPTLTFLGTVKLHGTNASIYSDLFLDNFITQSKNNIITPDNDNYGFSGEMTSIASKFVPLFNELKKEMTTFENKTAIIYGEWCGSVIQKDIALSKLPTMFVIFGIKIIDGQIEKWLDYDKVQSIFNINKKELEISRVYCIYNFPTWKIDINFNKPQLVQNDLVNITMAVEEECPVSKQFGITGIGEGVVWKNITESIGFSNSSLFFKVKGQEHSVSNVVSLAMVNTEKVKNVNEFVEKVVTDNRLKQGLEYLSEQHLDYSTENIKTFISWIVKDCFKEEKDMITESNLKEKDVAQSIAFKAKDWFISQNFKITK